MKIAVTSNTPSLDGSIDPRFGRCRYYLIVNTDDLSFEVLENPSISLVGGAGIQSAQLLAEKGVTHVLTGNCGPNAHQTLNAAGIGIIVGCSGMIREVIQQFKEGKLAGATQPNAPAHFGTGVTGNRMASDTVIQQGARPGMGRGMGMGRGRGMGMGRGMGRSMGQGVGFGQGNYPGPQVSNQIGTDTTSDDELDVLKEQATILNEQIQKIQEQIRDLEKKKIG